MKKFNLILINLLLVGCTQKASNIFNSSNYENISFTDTILIENALKSIQNNVIFNQVYTDLSSNTVQGERVLFYEDDAIKATGSASLSISEEETKVSDYTYVFMDKEDINHQAYEEILLPDNKIHKNYLIDSSNNYVDFNNSYVNVFKNLVPENFILETDKLLFASDDIKNTFINNFVSNYSDDITAYFVLNTYSFSSFNTYSISSFNIYNSQFTLVFNFIKRGNDVSVEHITPFEMDTSDKTDLEVAISKLEKNYTVMHYRSSEKFKTYYLGDQIICDASANSLSSMDTYYYQESDSTYLNRLSYGSKGISSPKYWSEDNYAEMSYANDSTYDDLLVRLNQINLGFFKNEGNSKYTSIEGAASLLFPYCQPTMDERALITDGASQIVIIVENQEIERIQLKYFFGAYGGEGVSKTDTIMFSDIGTTTMPNDYYNSIHQAELPLNEGLIGTFSYISDESSSNNISLTITAERNITYVIGDNTYEINNFYYYETDEKIAIGFDYNNNKRYVTLSYNSANNTLEGHDSDYSDYTDFFNMELTKNI